MTLFSAYSLAAINQVYKINFEWYSQYNHSFSDSIRGINDEKWLLYKYPKQMMINIFTGNSDMISTKNENIDKTLKAINPNFQEDVLLFLTLGNVGSPEYKIKVIDIAQRGNVVEIKVSLNSPVKSKQLNSSSIYAYFPSDIIKISKNAFPIKGKLYFIFKNQAGNKISESSCEIK